ncbi:MAG: hypothetical protein AB7T27_08675 [Kiritimatiellia bacterium]
MGAERRVFLPVLAALICGAAGLLHAQDRKVVSATGRFAALSPSEMDATYLVVWAEDAAARLEKLLGVPFPAPRGGAVYLIIGEGDGNISVEQYYDEFGLRQKLYIRGIEQADQEFLLESLCRLLLNRKTPDLQVPFWFAAGAAQNLFPEARSRNLETAIFEWTADRAPDFADVIADFGADAPDARKRAFAGQAVAAMLEWFSGSAQLEQFFSLCASGAGPDAESIAQLAGFPSVRDLEAAWDVWLASRQRVRAVGSGSPQLDASRLRAALAVSPELVQIVTGCDAQGGFPFQRMIHERDSDWVPAVAGHLSLKLESLALGSAPETQKVIQAWRDFLQAAAAREEKRPWYSTRSDGRKSERVLRALLRRAERMLEALEQPARTNAAE